MEFAKAQQYKARVAEKYYLSGSQEFLLIHLEFITPTHMEYVAGQYVSIKVNESGERRSYSMVSTPDMTHGITLVAEMVENGLGTTYLRDTPIGGEVEILGPLGRFVVESDQKLLFVATGAGITPIKCMIEDLLLNKKETRPMRLHWGMRSERDIFWFDNFERLVEAHPNFVFDQVLSRPSESWELCTGHVQDCLERDFGSTHSTSSVQAGSPQVPLEGWEAYVCGNQKTVESIETKLVELGMPKEKVHHEKFT